jgi:hypothetical protein
MLYDIARPFCLFWNSAGGRDGCANLGAMGGSTFRDLAVMEEW